MKPLDRRTVLDIRKFYDSGEPIGELAVQFRVSPRTVSNIAKRKTHKRVKERPDESYRTLEMAAQRSLRRRMTPEERAKDDAKRAGRYDRMGQHLGVKPRRPALPQANQVDMRYDPGSEAYVEDTRPKSESGCLNA